MGFRAKAITEVNDYHQLPEISHTPFFGRWGF